MLILPLTKKHEQSVDMIKNSKLKKLIFHQSNKKYKAGKISQEEVYRKLLHLISGTLIPAVIFYLPRFTGSIYPVIIISGICFFISLILEWSRFKVSLVQKYFWYFFKNALRKEEEHEITGATYIFASSFLCSVLFQNHLHIAFIVLNLFILGDGAASLVGISLGKIKIKNKTLEGSLACFVLCFIVMKWIYPELPFLLDVYQQNISVLFVFCVAFCITIFELLSFSIFKRKLNDNLTAPVFSGFCILALEKIFY